MDRETLRRACLAATVATVWTAAPAAEAVAPVRDQVYTRMNAHLTYINGVFVGVTNSNGTPDFLVNTGGIPAGESFRSYSTGMGSGSAPASFDRYVFVGHGLGSGNNGSGDFGTIAGVSHVTVSFSNPSIALGQPFQTLFPGFNEAEVAASIDFGGPGLDSFLAAVLALPGSTSSMEADGALVNFSNGMPGGSFLASFSPIPEPGSAIVCLGAIGFLKRRRVIRPSIL